MLLDQAGDTPIATCRPDLLPERPACHLWDPTAPDRGDDGPNEHEAIERLSHVGLSDPYTWARLPSELSEGQRHRLALADAIWQDAEAIVADDWLTPLDPLTARAVAWRTQRACRDLDIGAILVSPRDDLLLDTQPDIYITCRSQADPIVSQCSKTRDRPTICTEVAHDRGTWRDWQQLKHLHYIAETPTAVRSIHVLRHPHLDEPAAVAVLCHPELHNAARNAFTEGRYIGKHRRKSAQLLNQEVAALARIVVSPPVRGCGLAQLLIRQITAAEPIRYLECTAAMTRYHPFLRNCGFTHVPKPPDDLLNEWHAVVEAEQWDAVPPHDPDALRHAIDALPRDRRNRARRAVWYLYHRAVLYRRHRTKPPQRHPKTTDTRWPEAFRHAFERIHATPAYWILGPLRRDPSVRPQYDATTPAPSRP